MCCCYGTESRLFFPEKNITLYCASRKIGHDSGSEISVLPPSPKDKRKCCETFALLAANNSKILAYGFVHRQLDLGLQKPFSWTFVIADVTSPIISADFLKYFNLVDLKRQCLINLETSLFTYGNVTHKSNFLLSLFRFNSDYDSLLFEFPDITNPTLIKQTVPHSTVHHILTSRPPVTSKPRRLHPKLHEAVKSEFEFLLDL
ncbi:uncharacterized protein LOC118179850, partial [Stegodyphus dumicola]|uniref:uncharacterized protein LOC118179850 n=1 Tax=Stegodyphus dumicola TaxID=202533 RepID=UPI0015AC14C5